MVIVILMSMNWNEMKVPISNLNYFVFIIKLTYFVDCYINLQIIINNNVWKKLLR